MGVRDALVRPQVAILADEALLGVIVAGQQPVMPGPAVIVGPVRRLEHESLFYQHREARRQQFFHQLNIAAHAELGVQPAGTRAHEVDQLLRVDVAIFRDWLDQVGDIFLAAFPAIIMQVDG